MLRPLLLAAAILLPTPATEAQPPTRPAITGIAFARYYTTDPTAAAHFYGDTLGLTQTKLPGKLVYPIGHSQWVELVPTTAPPKANNRLLAVGFTTRDAAGLARYLTAHNVAIEIPLKNGEFAVRDPEGNLVYFVQSGSNKLAANAALDPKAPSHRMIHTGFQVQDAAKEDTFWRDILGFTPLWHGGFDDKVVKWSSVQVPEGSDWLEYMLDDGPTPTLRQSGSSNHISLGTEHMNTVVAALASQPLRRPQLHRRQDGPRRQNPAQPLRPGPDPSRIHGILPHRKTLLLPHHRPHPHRRRKQITSNSIEPRSLSQPGAPSFPTASQPDRVGCSSIRRVVIVLALLVVIPEGNLRLPLPLLLPLPVPRRHPERREGPLYFAGRTPELSTSLVARLQPLKHHPKKNSHQTPSKNSSKLACQAPKTLNANKPNHLPMSF